MSDDDSTLPLPPLPLENGRPRVYVVNSNEDFLEMISDILTDARLNVLIEQMRPNVEVTLGNLRSARPHLLMLDVVPYRDDARTLLNALSADAELGNLPVMLASTNPKIAEQLADEYPDQVRDVLPKPFDLDELYAKISQLVGASIP